MPYERKGKCVFNTETGKKVGCSKSITKAKDHMKALYAAENGNIQEETKPKLSDAVLDRAEDIYQAMKANNRKSFIGRYGKEAENVMRGAAIKRAKDQVMTTNEERLKEIIKNRLSTPPTKPMDEGKIGKVLGAAAILGSLIINSTINSNDSEIERLEKEYHNATDETVKDSIKKEIGQRLIFLDTGHESINEKKIKIEKSPIEEIIYEEEEDYEGEMAKTELYRTVEDIKDIISLLEDDTQLEAWVQNKITKAADYINSVVQHLKYQSPSEQPVFEKTEYYLKK